MSDYFKAYYQANKERLKAAAAKRRAEKPGECAAVVRAWFASDDGKERRREYFKDYAKTEPFKRAQRSYAERNPGVLQSRSAKRRAAKLHRTPAWLTRDERDQIRSLYELAAIYTDALGEPFEVDHVLPLQGSTVSGFHVPANLQVIHRAENRAKSNR
jgi:hypothetical protein